MIFLRQLIAQARPEDVAVGISTSGGSNNIIMALEEARKRNLLTVALLGYDGGEILRRGLADLPAGGPLATTSRAFRKCRRPSITSFASSWRLHRHGRRLSSTERAGCPYTQEMREWLEWQGREFDEYDVEARPEAL